MGVDGPGVGGGDADKADTDWGGGHGVAMCWGMGTVGSGNWGRRVIGDLRSIDLQMACLVYVSSSFVSAVSRHRWSM